MEEKKLTDEELNELIKSLEYQSWSQNLFELSQAAYMLKYQKAEIERLTEERKTANKHDLMYWFNAYKECTDDCEKYVIEASDNKAECIRLQKQVDELKNKCCEISSERYDEGKYNKFENKACCNMSENCPMVKQAVKDTAKEIYNELCGHGTTYVKKWIKERYGVEVE